MLAAHDACSRELAPPPCITATVGRGAKTPYSGVSTSPVNTLLPQRFCSVIAMKTVAAIIISVCLLVGVGLYRLNELNKISVHPDNYSTYNLVEIYVLGIVMSALAYPLYPEISQEHMSLYFEEKKPKHSKFFSTSKVVQKAVKNYTRPTMLAWPSSNYMIGNPEARASLALNGAMLSIEGDKVFIDVPIKYPRNSLVELAPMIWVQEGLFWVLQQKGWYKTGTMRWICALNDFEI